MNVPDNWGQDPVSHAAEKGRCVTLTLFLNQHHVEANVADDLGYRPLVWAVIGGGIVILELLNRGDADANAQDCCGRTVLA